MRSRMAKKFIDIGGNLLDKMYQGKYNGKDKHAPDLNYVLKRAWAMGMTHLIVTAGNLKDSQDALKFVENDPRLFCTVGVHPTNCNEFEDQKNDQNNSYLDELIKIAKIGAASGNIVAVGECGLDYDRLHYCDKDTQLKHFDKHFKIVQATGLPMFLHNRRSTKDLYNILKQNRDKWNKGVVHSFSDSLDDMKLLLQLDGLYIGINGCSLKSDDNLNVVKEIPINRLMIETDCPWCGIRKSHSGYKYVATHYPEVNNKKHSVDKCVKGRCEPCHIIQVLEVIAAIKGEDINTLCEIIYQNTLDVFFTNTNTNIVNDNNNDNGNDNDVDDWHNWLIKQHLAQ